MSPSQTRSQDILLIEKKGYVMTLTLNRPEKRNSLSPELLFRMAETLDTFARDDQVRAVVIQGAGDHAFSSGYDMNAIPTEGVTESQGLNPHAPLERGLQSIIHFPYPVIALINGYAFGAGCELALCCDLRIGVEETRMGMPPAKLGVVYPVKGLDRFVKRLGLARTKELFFTGRYYSAPQALEMGLLDHVLPKSQVNEFTHQLADEISCNAPLSVKGTKRILNLLTQDLHLAEADLQEAERIVGQAFSSQDLKEGKAAFQQGRKPVFKGC